MVTALLAQWNELDLSRKVVALLGLLALISVVGALARMTFQPSMVLLYSGLEARASGDVIRALEQKGIVHEIRGGAIFVPAQERDSLRMTLASEGLPSNSSRGYELLDSLSGFGTTSQMFDAAYLRAKEGELARTIVSAPQISSARVHIAQTRQSAFSREKTGSASVFLTPATGSLDPSQAKALRYLVASAVAGVSPDHVSIIDDEGGLIGVDDQAQNSSGGDEAAQNLREKVGRILEARVGAGNAIVEVSVETVMQSESIMERVFDPEGRVIISTDNEERSDSEEDTGGGGVTVASNLPDGNGATQENSKSQGSETRERVNYEVSETQREILKSPGAIKKISIAVLVNGVADPTTPGVLLPRQDEELEQLEELVRSAVGFDQARGDLITVQSMPFVPTAPSGTGPIEAPLFDMTLSLMTLVQMGILAIVGLIIAFLVVRPILSPKPQETIPALSPPEPSFENDWGGDPLDGEISFEAPQQGTLAMFGDDPSESGFGNDVEADNPVTRLREMIETRQEETVDILRQWLEQKERQNS